MQRKTRLFGLVAAIVALAGQVALGAVVQRVTSPQAELAALAAVSIICHASHNSGSDDGKSLPPPVSDWALCPLDHALAHGWTLLTPSLIRLAPPTMLAARTTFTPPARAPPFRFLTSVYPRGPPALI
jgi:hypothetical protein